jgi:4-hydroxy-3-methylbut-2-enyl diphosphate reductase
MMRVVRAETAGFCMGVDLALNKLDSLIDKGVADGIFILGPIIHNLQVLEEYAAKGVTTARTPDEIPSGASAVIRAHGVPRTVEELLRLRGVRITDATCPKVKKAQLLIQTQTRKGRTLLLYGEGNHPEVKGLLSYAESGAFLFDQQRMLDELPLNSNEQYCLAAQTTQDREGFEAIAEELSSRRDIDVAVLHTICDATRERQQEAVRIAREVEFMVVVGGYISGNTRRLVQVAQDQRTPCLHVETVQELPLDKLKKYSAIGLTAGASTPKEIIDEVSEALTALP